MTEFSITPENISAAVLVVGYGISVIGGAMELLSEWLHPGDHGKDETKGRSHAARRRRWPLPRRRPRPPKH